MSERKKVFITGGTGFIGYYLCHKLLSLGYEITVLTRNKLSASEKLPKQISLISSFEELSVTKKFNIIINLAGENLAKRRWTEKSKELFLKSRIDSTKDIIDYIKRAKYKPDILISSSAISYYGFHGKKKLLESDPPQNIFASKICEEWENEAWKARSLGVKVYLLRIGLVLARDGNVLPNIVPIFKLGLGGYWGDGKQYMSWIHLDDMIDIIIYLIYNEQESGPFNCTSPAPVTNKEFLNSLSDILKKPCFVRIPAYLLRLLIGEMADSLMLKGQRVIPDKLLNAGYQFKFTHISSALENIIKAKGQPIFKSIFAENWDNLPIVMHKHYANHPYSNDVVTVEGKMDIKFGPLAQAFRPLFVILGALVPYQGTNIPTIVKFCSETDSNAFLFNRTFNFPGKPIFHFNSRMVPQSGNEMIEYMRFGIGWKCAYSYDGKKIILSHKGYIWKIFGVKIPIPVGLILGKGYAQEEEISDDSFKMRMYIKHPIWGQVYEYKGKFKIVNE